mgnify:CR=1 FL=1
MKKLQAMFSRLGLIIAIGLITSNVTVHAAEQAVIDNYSKTCAVCHVSGVAGAPRTGNKDDWGPRLEKGLDVLIASVEKGLNAMPANGLCTTCSTEDFKALIDYMSKAK